MTVSAKTASVIISRWQRESTMESDFKSLPWWALTKRILFSPRVFFAQTFEAMSYRSSLIYLAKTTLLVSLISALILSIIFYVIVASFTSILSAFVLVFGILITPLLAVAMNIPPEKVPAALESFARNGDLQVATTSIRLAAFLFVAYLGCIFTGTFVQAGIAHGVARLLGSRASFRATVCVYSLGSAAYLLSIIPLVSFCAPFYAAVLIALGLRSAHNLSIPKATLATITAWGLPILCLMIFAFQSN